MLGSGCTSWNICIRDLKTRLRQGSGVRNIFLEEVSSTRRKKSILLGWKVAAARLDAEMGIDSFLRGWEREELGRGTAVDEGDRAVSSWPHAQLQRLGNGASEAGYEKCRLPPPLLTWGGEEIACMVTAAMEMT